jgi:hypothetical protein
MKYHPVFHPKSSEGISLLRCTRISLLETPAGSVLHGSGASIGGEHLCGLMRGLRKRAEYEKGFVRGDPYPS